MGLKTLKCCCGNGCCVPAICYTVDVTWYDNHAETPAMRTDTVTLAPAEVSGFPEACTYFGSFQGGVGIFGNTGCRYHIILSPTTGEMVVTSDWCECRWYFDVTPVLTFGQTCNQTLTASYRTDNQAKMLNICARAYDDNYGGAFGENIFVAVPSDTLYGTYGPLVPDLEIVPAPNCPEVVALNCPICLNFYFEGVTDDTCTNCIGFNIDGNPPDQLIFSVARAASTCAYAGSVFTPDACTGGATAQWIVAYDSGTTTWSLSLVIYDGGGSPIGSLVNYELVDATDIFPKTLNLDAGTGCTWPATVTIRVCDEDPNWGACCQTIGSVGVSICGEDRESSCASIGGTFLGIGTRCHQEGCFDCTYPSDCIVISNEHPAINLVISGVTGTCAASINGTHTLTHTTGCEWQLVISLGGASITITLTANGLNAWDLVLTSNVGMDATLQGSGFCDADVPLALISSSSTGICTGTDLSTMTAYLDLA